jgi:hypothetical protein
VIKIKKKWLYHAEFTARLLDDGWLIPGTRWKIGLDPVIGLIPGWGDAISTAISLYVPYCGMQLKCPKSLVMKMLLNIGLDALISVIPVLGDLFDFGFKANRRNALLLRDWWERRPKKEL